MLAPVLLLAGAAANTQNSQLGDEDWQPTRTVVPWTGPMADLRSGRWFRWDLDLQELVRHNPTFRLESVKRMGIGVVVSDMAATTPSVIDIDDLSIDALIQRNGIAFNAGTDLKAYSL